MKQKVILILSVVIGLLASFLTHSYLLAKDKEVAKRLRDFASRHRQVEVVCVKRELPSGTILQREDLGVIKVFEASLRDHVIREKDAFVLIGRKTVSPLKPRSVIFWSDIAGGEPGRGGLSRDIQKKMRAISVNVTGSGSVSGMVRPNDHVDVLGTFSFPSKEVQGEMELVTLTMLQNVLVLATGKETAKSQTLSAGRGVMSYNMVTLEVTPREAEMLVFAEQIKGRISLALRHPDDVYFEKELPRIDFKKIQDEIEALNTYRQEHILRKRP